MITIHLNRLCYQMKIPLWAPSVTDQAIYNRFLLNCLNFLCLMKFIN